LKNTFKKHERLCSKKDIESLFDRKNTGNSSAFAYPFRVVFKPFEEGESESTKVLFSIPKKQFKHAVDRNLIRRRSKEAYRLNKSLVEGKYMIVWIYVGKKIEDYEVIRKGVRQMLKKISNDIH